MVRWGTALLTGKISHETDNEPASYSKSSRENQRSCYEIRASAEDRKQLIVRRPPKYGSIRIELFLNGLLRIADRLIRGHQSVYTLRCDKALHRRVEVFQQCHQTHPDLPVESYLPVES
jgi:hypothetical protein